MALADADTVVLPLGGLASILDAILWPVIIVVILIIFRQFVFDLVNTINKRIKKGAAFSLGADGFKLDALKDQVEEQSKRIDQLTVSTESTLQSLASLVIADPLNIPTYMQQVNKRLESDKTIIIGCQQYTEQRILCAIISKLLARSHLDFDEIIPKYDFGGANLNFIALSRGDIDIYPGYTWQGYEMAYATSLPQSTSNFMDLEPQAAIDMLNSIFKDLSSPLQWLCYTGFRNNWEMIIRRKDSLDKELVGEEITKVSQLRALNNKLNIGCEHDFFARPNGYTLLTKPEPNGYGLSFKNLKLFRHMDAYKNLDDSEVDVIDGFSTDPDIHNSNKYIRLEDDEKRFGYYYSSIVVREKIIDKYPEVAAVLKKLEGKIDAKQMSHMIEVAERYSIIDEREEHIASVENVAERFLDDNNL